MFGAADESFFLFEQKKVNEQKKAEANFANIMGLGPDSGPESLIIPSLRPGTVCFPYSPEANF